MARVDDYRGALRELGDWVPYLAANSGLPGPRANLDLVAACGEEADVARAERLVATGDEFATVCGLVALGRHLGGGDDRHAEVLHELASDGRWRVREGVAMALQRAPATTIPRGASRWPSSGRPIPTHLCGGGPSRPCANRDYCAIQGSPGERSRSWAASPPT